MSFYKLGGLVRCYYRSQYSVQYCYEGESRALRRIMVAKLRQMIHDYLPKHRKRRGGLLQYKAAAAWIFDDTEATFEVFGFSFICTYLGIDPGRARRLIRTAELALLNSDATINIDEPKGGSNEKALLADPGARGAAAAAADGECPGSDAAALGGPR